ncbi:MAG TPA: DUF3307 domain-containing protein [Candidatus Omnitrophota bacterium]|nr:DUF3307 domain-containing protein [Candidatus Omnitrophota bacterium]HPD84852.1 DUF3307 domain-containing protein [Candidatus Omnitrophota bacterium]HRZ03710.1 DUF3307 domain-containing protein [Candidatus Omnitrophota bacterium]
MFIFLRLLLAHFVGDFPLQLNVIFRLKNKGLRGIIPHAFIITLCCITLSWPYLHLPQLWLFVAFIGVTHLAQDSIKLSYGTIKYSFWTYLLDQLSHVGIIALVFFTDLKNLQPPCDQSSLIVRIYSNDMLIVYLIALILVTYNGLFLIRNFKITFMGKSGIHHSFEKWYGMVERALIVSAFFTGGYAFLWLPAVMLARPLLFFSWRKQLGLHKNFISFVEISLSWIIAVIVGVALYLFQANYSVY